MGERFAIAYDCLFPVHHGGGERVYRRIAELLVARGNRVTYVTRSDWSTDAAPRAPFDVVGIWRGAIYDEHGTRTTRSALAFAAALFRHFSRHRRSYDVVVVAALPVLNVFAVRLALTGTPTRLVVDWLEVWGGAKWRSYAGVATGTIAWLLQSVGTRIGDVLTVNSRFTADRLRRARPSVEPVVLGLVDLVGEAPEASATAPEPPSVLFVGRHSPDKRLEVLPRAVAAARRTLPELRLVIVGTGPETERVRSAAAEAGISSVVEFLGRVDDAELQRRFLRSSVLVNPSAREGFGLVVAEAAAAGTPSVVVVGADNAAADLIEDGVNGEIAPDATPEELGAAIVRVVSAGEPLRRTTLEWFRRARIERGLEASVDRLLEHLGTR